MAKGKLIFVKKADGSDEKVPALLISQFEEDGVAIVVEADPLDFNRKEVLNGGASRVYFFGSGRYPYEEVGDVEISDDVARAARDFVSSSYRLHVAASVFGPLAKLLA